MKSIYYRQNKYIDMLRMLFLESVPTFKILKLFSFISLYYNMQLFLYRTDLYIVLGTCLIFLIILDIKILVLWLLSKTCFRKYFRFWWILILTEESNNLCANLIFKEVSLVNNAKIGTKN